MRVVEVSQEAIKEAIEAKELACPECSQPISAFDQYVATASSVWDGAGDTTLQTGGCKVTLICGNGGCKWQERTEYWENFYADE